MKPSQRETAAGMALLLALLGVLTGLPPADLNGTIANLGGPLTAMAASLHFLFQSIQNNVAAGKLTPGSLLELLGHRPFAYAMGVGIVFISQRFLLTATDDATIESYIDLSTNVLMFVGAYLIKSFADRPAKDPTTITTK